MIDYQLYRFCESWLKKAEAYNLEELSDCFDAFFTLYVAYNRLYVEVTFQLVNKGIIKIDTSDGKFPDTNAATRFLLKAIDVEEIMAKINSNNNMKHAVSELIRLIHEERFHITLKPNGDAHRDKDLVLLKNLNSVKESKRMGAILEIIYLIRCNLFHGHKGYELTQRELLKPACIILNFLTEEILAMLKKT